MRACTVFKLVHMNFLQHAVGIGDDLDTGASVHHMPALQICMCIPDQAIWNPTTGHVASQNRAYGCTMGTPP